MSKAYSSNLTPAQWELLEPLIPPVKPGGRPREIEIWEVLNGIFYVLCTGCTAAKQTQGTFNSGKRYTPNERNWRIEPIWDLFRWPTF